MRVIAGSLGGRRLLSPKGRATRPTSDRVREALFSVLGDISNAVVLDLFAGTGALGIEALSRGARRAVFVENSRPALVALRANIAALGLGGSSRVLSEPVRRAIEVLEPEGPFDLVFLDPPYAVLGDMAEVLARVAAKLTSSTARLVLEHSSRDEPPEAHGLSVESTRIYGDTSITFYALDRRGETGSDEVASGAL